MFMIDLYLRFIILVMKGARAYGRMEFWKIILFMVPYVIAGILCIVTMLILSAITGIYGLCAHKGLGDSKYYDEYVDVLCN